LLGWHAQFTRFDRDSELSRLNHDARRTVPVSPMMGRFVEAAVAAAETSEGLVDPTLLSELEAAGYANHFAGVPVPLRNALAMAPPRRTGGPSALARWRLVSVDGAAGTVTRPPGVLLDSGGVAKGLFADVLASVLGGHASFAVNLAGDLRFGGRAGLTRPVQVTDPFDGSLLHVFEQTEGAVATSGISRRSWLDANGVAAHHLLDPASGLPAFTGVVQVTALAPSALRAEVLAKAALLSGPERAATWLVHGGLVVRDDGSHELIEPSSAPQLAERR
jgi:thiamine biosynthesis lipoprotein